MNSAAIFEEFQLRREVDDAGDTRYYDKNYRLHRDFGPAVIYGDGSKFWYHRDQLHRLDGPAITWRDGYYDWFIHGKSYSEEDYWKEVERLKNGNY